MKYSQIPENTFEELQLNAGIFLSDFNPSDGSFEQSALLGATTGGATFSDTPTYEDFGADIDNAPRNTKELLRIAERSITMSGTYVTVNTANAKSLIGAADVDSSDLTKVTPRDTLKDGDFSDVWWVGDYSNGDGGFVAIHLMNALSTGGFSFTSGDRAKGQFGFTYSAHYSIEDQDTVPYEIYVKSSV